jgi:polar amino acid transport system substrate-binding protein
MSKSLRAMLVVIVVAAAVGITVAVVTAAPTTQPQQAATQTPTPKTGASGGDWARIKAAGKIIVGTSADYPPFEYYTPDFKTDGFDIALMQQIGKQLGVSVQFRDMAFDGLLDALQLGQVDMAIAAISTSPERDAVVDFTNVYYVGEDAVLARKDSRIDALRSVDDVAHQRIGVQKGTVYETWLRDNLVDKGLMDAQDLMLYTDISQAVRDLKAGRVDLVALDAGPAATYVAQGGVKIVEQGLHRQTYAMAVPQGATALQDQLNLALGKLQDQGVVSQLVSKYLKLKPAEVLPLPTPVSVTPTPGPTATPEPCKDGMSYVADLNYDDKGMTAPPVMQPGQPFTKGWRVRNSGTCPWDQTYTLGYDGGSSPAAQMGGSAVRVNGTVAPGATYDFKVPLTAPSAPGVYQGFWSMRDWQGTAFGDRIWVGIQVPSPPTPPPPPTPQPGAEINFWVDSNYIQAGQCTTIHWDVKNVREVYFYDEGESWQGHGVSGKEDRKACPQKSTSYYLRVVKTDGSVETREVRIEVAAPPKPSAPIVTSVGTNPSGQIVLGACLQLYWDTQGDINRVSVTYNGQMIWDYAPVRGSMNHCPSSPGGTTYVVQASGPGGQAQGLAYVDVIQAQVQTL